jgi:hypothetical protein
MTRTIALGIVIALASPMMAMAANDLAAIHGQVHDSSGAPLVGALVTVAASSPVIPERIGFTDRRGSFSIVNLFAGEYSVKISMPRFLPALKPGIRLNAGGSVILTVNLQNAMDIVRRATTRDRAQSDDIVWTLRSSRSTQPVLRWAGENLNPEDGSSKSIPTANYSGYFQVYSKSVETSSGSADGVGSQFSLTMPLDPSSRVTFAGQYTEAPMQPRGFGATYDFVPAERHKATVGVNLKQGALLGDPLQLDSLKEVQVQYGEDFQWSDHFVFNYGAEMGRAQALVSQSYLRPRFGISWVPAARTTISLGTSAQEPATEDDPIRGKEYFDRPVYVPPALERYSHSEATFKHFFSENTELSAAMFRDLAQTQALFVGLPGGRTGVLILDTRRSPSEGFRVHLDRRFRSFEAGLGFTTATGVGFANPDSTVNDMRNQLTRQRTQVVAARFKADLDATQTEITAVYRWVSNFSASRIDPYQRLVEYNDPTLSLSIAQNLPTLRMFPAKLQAIVDARNLFEQSFGPQRTQIAQYPRLVKGGINIKF